MPVGQTQRTTQRYSCTIVTSDPSSGTIEALLPGQLKPVMVQSTPVAFRWPIAGETWYIININGTFYLESPVPIQYNSSTSVSTVQNLVTTTTTAALSPSAAVTSLTVAALPSLLAQSSVTITDPTGIYSQSWETTGAEEGATSIPVTSQTPNYAYPTGSTIDGSGVTTINDVTPGDAVINAPTGKIWVLGDNTGTNDWSLSNDSWFVMGEAGGDLEGSYPNPTLAQVTSSDWIALPYTTGWSDYAPTVWTVGGYMKDPLGFVHLRGFIAATAAASEDIFALPTGYQPIHNEMFAVGSDPPTDGIGVIQITAGSPCYVSNRTPGPGAAVVYMSLSGITFLAEA